MFSPTVYSLPDQYGNKMETDHVATAEFRGAKPMGLCIISTYTIFSYCPFATTRGMTPFLSGGGNREAEFEYVLVLNSFSTKLCIHVVDPFKRVRMLSVVVMTIIADDGSSCSATLDVETLMNLIYYPQKNETAWMKIGSFMTGVHNNNTHNIEDIDIKERGLCMFKYMSNPKQSVTLITTFRLRLPKFLLM